MVSAELSAWLERIQRFHSSEIELGLSRLETVAKALDISPNAFIITVAGTNGKGSTISGLNKICAAHQLKTGVYTSPHFLRFNERIIINHQEVSDTALINAFDCIEQARGETPLTFFEYTTLAALLLFKQADLDVWILEVGLGGRLDAVNIIDADIAVITSIGLDHQEYLGDTRELIGFEKAGIFRKGKTAVIGDIDYPQSIHNHAEDIEVNALFRNQDFSLKNTRDRAFIWQGRAISGESLEFDFNLSSQMIADNAATILQTLYAWKPHWDKHLIADVLANFSMKGRSQVIEFNSRKFIIDVAHNSHAASAFLNNLPAEKQSYEIILGMLSDKDYQQVIALLAEFAQSWHVVDLPTERNLGKQVLSQCILERDAQATIAAFDTVEAALDAVIATESQTTILLLGSFYTVAEALDYFKL